MNSASQPQSNAPPAPLSGEGYLTVRVSTARGAIPELVFNYLLSVHGVTDVTVEWIEATGLAAKLKSEAGAIVLSPEPNATAILANVEGSRRALHLGDEWAALDNGAEYVTGVVVARTAFIEENPTAVENFLKV